MLVIRPVSQNDETYFLEIAHHANIALTSMPRDPALLIKRLKNSEHSFAKKINKPQDEKYLFVLEDTSTKKIGGMCGIVAKDKHESPVVLYRIDETSHTSDSINHFPTVNQTLRPVKYYEMPSELCSLFITPDFRKKNIGRLLSLSRFHFIAAFPERFDPMLYANLCGYTDAKGHCKFWDGIGRHFYNQDFYTTMFQHGDEILDMVSILPEYPIYIDLLPKDVQDSIGKVHPSTIPALNMLIQEGFLHTREIDPIDGGPIIEIETAKVRTIQSSIVDRIADITQEPIDGPNYILSNNRIDFRCCYGSLQHRGHHGVAIDQQLADALQLHQGELIRYSTPVA